MKKTAHNGILNGLMRHPVCTSTIPTSPCADNTINPIRGLVDNLVINPNPDKPFLRLSIGDPSVFGNFDPPPQVIKAVADNLTTSCYGYVPAHGLVSTRSAIAKYYNTASSPLTSNDVFVTSGCSDALRIAMDCLGSEKRNILLPKPGFSLYQTIAGNRGIPVKFYDLDPENNWSIDLNQLESLIDENTAAILVTNPSNPCGSAFSVQHQRDILSVAEKHGLPLIADEIYQDMVYDGESKSFGELSEHVPVLSCCGLAKRWLIPGWRVGWLIAHDRHNRLSKVRDGLTKLCQVIIGANVLIQGAVPQILETVPQSFYDDTLKRLKSASEVVYSELKDCPQLRPFKPQGAMYMMVQLKIDQFEDIGDDMEFVEKLITEQSVFPLPANIFGIPNYVRLVLTVPEDILREACQRIVEFCDQHKAAVPRKISRIEVAP
ncbi:tyrosine aminotransferase-like [Bolinopsis microptera]|uniref:tyrosine aminotransferase-like n=1 Tax=Bolinopsis microptera TaxID=2820187 RepID=UPI00307A8E47